LISKTNSSSFNVGGGNGTPRMGKRQIKTRIQAKRNLNKLKLEEQSKYNDLFLKQERQLEDDRISTMQDGYEKELLIENQRYKEK
jgi:tubulin-specific chaperone A